MPHDKTSIADLAVFGGQRALPPSRIAGRRQPKFSTAFTHFVRQAYDSRRLSNDGPMIREIERRLADHHKVEHCIAVANVGLALLMLIQTLAGGRSGEVIMPAFSFRQYMHLTRWAGQSLRLCDVDPVHHMATADLLRRHITHHTTVILATCGLRGCGDLAALELLAEKSGIPLILESSYGIGMRFRGKPLGCNGTAEVFSLQAVHQQQGFEGAYITTRDDRLAAILKQQRNFCFTTEPDFPPCAFPWVIGLNAKLNEVHASLALACIYEHDDLSDLVSTFGKRCNEYEGAFCDLPGVKLIHCHEDGDKPDESLLRIIEISSDWILSRDETVMILRQEGFPVAPYFSPLFDYSSAPSWESDEPNLQTSRRLSERYIQLPFGDAIDSQDISTLGCFLKFVAKYRHEIAESLHQDRIRL